MNERQIFGCLFALLITLMSFVGVNLACAVLISDGGTLGMWIWPLLILVWFWLLCRLWSLTYRKLFPTTKDPQ